MVQQMRSNGLKVLVVGIGPYTFYYCPTCTWYYGKWRSNFESSRHVYKSTHITNYTYVEGVLMSEC